MLPSFFQLFVTLSLALLLKLIYQLIYNCLLHPLAQFPGPRLWAFSRLPYCRRLVQGRLHARIKKLHDTYGPVVRIAPDELSFIDRTAWQDIYTGGVGNKGFPKNRACRNAQGFESLFDAPDDNHTRLRKLLAKTFFSLASVEKQETTLQSYADVLVRQLQKQVYAATTRPEGAEALVNLQEWYNFATFDLAGKITTDEDFGCLSGHAYHPWITMVLTHFRLSTLVMCLRIYSLEGLVMRLTPTRLSRLRDTFLGLIREKVQRRLARQYSLAPPNDFISAALRKPESGGMSREELEANCILMMAASSETMATSILSATNFLCYNPHAWRALTAELRQFTSESQLTLACVRSLPYLNAVIRESHRLAPPLANGPSRVVGSQGAQVSGYRVPAETLVGVTQYAANLSSRNFAQATQFLPERWLSLPECSPYTNDHRDVVRPYSLGGRDCPGKNIAAAEYQILLARMIWNFDMTAVDDKPWYHQKAYMLWAKEAFEVRLSLSPNARAALEATQT